MALWGGRLLGRERRREGADGGAPSRQGRAERGAAAEGGEAWSRCALDRNENSAEAAPQEGEGEEEEEEEGPKGERAKKKARQQKPRRCRLLALRPLLLLPSVSFPLFLFDVPSLEEKHLESDVPVALRHRLSLRQSQHPPELVRARQGRPGTRVHQGPEVDSGVGDDDAAGFGDEGRQEPRRGDVGDDPLRDVDEQRRVEGAGARQGAEASPRRPGPGPARSRRGTTTATRKKKQRSLLRLSTLPSIASPGARTRRAGRSSAQTSTWLQQRSLLRTQETCQRRRGRPSPRASSGCRARP